MNSKLNCRNIVLIKLIFCVILINDFEASQCDSNLKSTTSTFNCSVQTSLNEVQNDSSKIYFPIDDDDERFGTQNILQKPPTVRPNFYNRFNYQNIGNPTSAKNDEESKITFIDDDQSRFGTIYRKTAPQQLSFRQSGNVPETNSVAGARESKYETSKPSQSYTPDVNSIVTASSRPSFGSILSEVTDQFNSAKPNTPAGSNTMDVIDVIEYDSSTTIDLMENPNIHNRFIFDVPERVCPRGYRKIRNRCRKTL